MDNKVRETVQKNDVVFKLSHTGWEQGLPIGDGSFGGLVFHNNSQLAWTINHLDVIQSRYRYTAASKKALKTAIRIMEVPFQERVKRAEWNTQDDINARRAELAKRSPLYYPEKGLEQGYTIHPVCGTFQLWFENRHEKVAPLQQRLHLYDGIVSSQYENVLVKSFVSRKYRVLAIRIEGLEEGQNCHIQMATDYIRFDKNLPKFYSKGNLFWSDYTLECNNFRFTPMVSVCGGQLHLKVSNTGITGVVKQNSSAPLTFFITVSTKYQTHNTVAKAKTTLSTADRAGYEKIFKYHQKWWNNFWKKSCIEIDDRFIENLWYINLYALACTNGAGQMKEHSKDCCGLYGLFMGEDRMRWANGWFCDVNIQQAYWPFFTTNHTDFVKPFLEQVENLWRLGKVRAREIFNMRGANMDAGKYMCIGPWYCQFIWWYYIYTGNISFLKKKGYPIMKDIGLFFVDYLQKDSDSRYYIYPTYSPEQGSDMVRNATIDLASLKYLFKVLMKCCDILRIDSNEKKIWKNVFLNLSDYPVGTANEKLVLKDSESVSPSFFLRHPSLLMPIYPLKEVETISCSKPFNVAKNTVMNVAKRIELVSFSQTWIASAMASLGLGDKSLDYLYRKFIGYHLRINGLFSDDTPYFKQRCDIQIGEETGITAPPYLDSAGSFVSAVNEMLFSGFDDRKITVFEGTPKKWKKARFSGFLTPHGFVVEAERIHGITSYVLIKSKQGKKCRLANPFGKKKVQVKDLTSTKKIFSIASTEINFPTVAGHTYEITSLDSKKNSGECSIQNKSKCDEVVRSYRTGWGYTLYIGGDIESDTRRKYEEFMYGFFLEKVYAFSFTKYISGHTRIRKDNVYSKKDGWGWQTDSSDTFTVDLLPGRYSIMQLDTINSLKKKQFDVTNNRQLQLKVKPDKIISVVIKRPSQYMVLGPVDEKKEALLPERVNLQKGNFGLKWRRVVLDSFPDRSINLGDAEKGNVYYVISDIFSDKKKKVLVMTAHDSSSGIQCWNNGKRIFHMVPSFHQKDTRQLRDIEIELRKGWNRFFLKIESVEKQHIKYIFRVTDRMCIGDTAFGYEPG